MNPLSLTVAFKLPVVNLAGAKLQFGPPAPAHGTLELPLVDRFVMLNFSGAGGALVDRQMRRFVIANRVPHFSF